jgi:hypothetical protein
VVFYQAALLVDPKNFMAANDLGVLLARAGDFVNSRRMLEYSVLLCPQSTTWHNLEIVYRQLGEAGLSGWAERQEANRRQVELAQQKTGPASSTSVRWIDPEAFAQGSGNATVPPGAAPSPARAGTQPAGQSVAAASRSASPRQGPAPTPAAAQRESWGSADVQR